MSDLGELRQPDRYAGALMAAKQKMPMAFIYAAIAIGVKRGDAAAFCD
jgi:hypothetical protein